jgi:uncharacterized protein
LGVAVFRRLATKARRCGGRVCGAFFGMALRAGRIARRARHGFTARTRYPDMKRQQSPMSDYVPRPALRNGHLMTIVCWGRPRRFPHLPPPEARLFDVAAGTRVLAHCHWQADRASRPLLLALHGLEGSSAAHYMRGLADKAFARGFNVILLNQRNCGGTEQLAAGLYHSGLTHDADVVLREVASTHGIDRVVVAGYSLGGNLALKLAGDYGREAPAELRGVCAVSPVIELAACVQALERRPNFVYQWNFVRGLKARMRRKAGCFPGRFPVERLGQVSTVRAFDEIFTAPHFGFAGAEDYYHRASAMRVVDRIGVPALVIAAEDDPFVPAGLFRDPRLTGNPHVRAIVTRHGGHCGFLEAAADGWDGYWAERRIIEFAREVTGEEGLLARHDDRVILHRVLEHADEVHAERLLDEHVLLPAPDELEHGEPHLLERPPRPLHARPRIPCLPRRAIEIEGRDDVGERLDPHVREACGLALLHQIANGHVALEDAEFTRRPDRMRFPGVAEARLGEDHGTVRPQHAEHLFDRELRVRQMVQRVQADGLVGRPVGKRQRFEIAGNETSAGRHTLAADAQHVLGDVDADRAEPEAFQPGGHPAAAGADIEHHVARLWLEALHGGGEIGDEPQPLGIERRARPDERLRPLPLVRPSPAQVAPLRPPVWCPCAGLQYRRFC